MSWFFRQGDSDNRNLGGHNAGMAEPEVPSAQRDKKDFYSVLGLQTEFDPFNVLGLDVKTARLGDVRKAYLKAQRASQRAHVLVAGGDLPEGVPSQQDVGRAYNYLGVGPSSPERTRFFTGAQRWWSSRSRKRRPLAKGRLQLEVKLLLGIKILPGVRLLPGANLLVGVRLLLEVKLLAEVGLLAEGELHVEVKPRAKAKLLAGAKILGEVDLPVEVGPRAEVRLQAEAVQAGTTTIQTQILLEQVTKNLPILILIVQRHLPTIAARIQISNSTASGSYHVFLGCKTVSADGPRRQAVYGGWDRLHRWKVTAAGTDRRGQPLGLGKGMTGPMRTNGITSPCPGVGGFIEGGDATRVTESEYKEWVLSHLSDSEAAAIRRAISKRGG
ncbi:MAG: hypothetical protein Q9227_005172 [Pyrenula ochraceoflavens]